jgi:CreA protein
MRKVVLALVAWSLVGLYSATASAEHLHTVKTSGIMFKDSIEVHVFDDPTIGGVSCYYTMPKRSMSFEDQTNSSISCRQVGRITGELVTKSHLMKASKGLFVKSLVIDRVYDSTRHVLVYLTYTKKMYGDNASNSISVVPIR